MNITQQDGKRWVIESTPISDTDLSPGDNGQVQIAIDRWVELAYKIFRDLDDDNESDVGEGISNATVSLSSPEYWNLTLITDSDGSIAVFLPGSSDWSLSVQSTGFLTVSENITMQAIRNNGNIQLMPDEVEVEGTISYIDDEQFSIIADDIILELIPVEGLVLDSVTPERVLVDGEWMGNWTAQVEPGNWILRATYEGQNLVAMGLVQAEVAVGASVDFEMTVGGWMTLETEWLDFEGATRTLADTDIEGADELD